MGSGTSERVGVVGWGASGLMKSLSQVGRASVDGAAARADGAGPSGTRLGRLGLWMTRDSRAGPGGRAGPRPSGRSARRGVAADGLGDDRGHLVRVHVGVGPTVLEPALLGLGHRPRDADGGAPVRGAVAELGEVLGLVRPREAALDAHAVHGDVLVDPLPDGLAPGDDGVPTALLAH